jgi:hypothetical protein
MGEPIELKPDQQRGQSGVRNGVERALDLITEGRLEPLRERHGVTDAREGLDDSPLCSRTVLEVARPDDVADNREHE